MESDQNKASERGFDAMDPKKPKQVASEDSRSAHKKDTTQEWGTNEASETGKNNKPPDNSNDKQNRGEGRKGREDWGGYKGY